MNDEDAKKFFQGMQYERDAILHDSIKQSIQSCIDLLQKEYNTIITNPECTEYQALEYIILFVITGSILATLLGSNMDEYLTAADAYAQLLGLYGDVK